MLLLKGPDLMYRLCEEPYPRANPIYSLSDKSHILEKIDVTLDIKMDVGKDGEDGYPDLICCKAGVLGDDTDPMVTVMKVETPQASPSRVVGSELIPKYRGERPKLVSELFRAAEKHAPSIVFRGEIDAVGIKKVRVIIILLPFNVYFVLFNLKYYFRVRLTGMACGSSS